jgi:hypothetical protein
MEPSLGWGEDQEQALSFFLGLAINEPKIFDSPITWGNSRQYAEKLFEEKRRRAELRRKVTANLGSQSVNFRQVDSLDNLPK